MCGLKPVNPRDNTLKPMWIQKPKHLRKIKHPDMDSVEELPEKEKCQVKQSVGEILVANYDAITEHTPE